MIISGEKYKEIIIKTADDELIISITDDTVIEHTGYEAVFVKEDE